MIKPPFTILILKKSLHPQTIRISTFSFIMVFIIAPILFVCIGFGLSFVWKGSKDTVTHMAQKHETLPDDPLTLEPVNSAPGTPVKSNSPEITDLFVSKIKSGKMEITFSLLNVPADEKSYIWTIINPDDVSTGEMVIYPRNPTFRGFPLDYRNGIPYGRSTGRRFEIILSDEITGIEIRKIRILAYSAEGKIFLNKEFSVNQGSR
ncbi:MAG: hypothetical protein WCU00_11675 [Candidatus Latescibacterota bacterium]|jgi:hypothetical protein